MRKSYLLTAFLAVLLCVPMSVSAVKKLAYITGADKIVEGAVTGIDTSFVKGLSVKFDVTVVPTTHADYSEFDVLVLSAVPSSSASGLSDLEAISVTKPFVNMKSFQLQSSRWKWAAPANTTINKVVIPDTLKNHPLFNNISFSGDAKNEIVLCEEGTLNAAIKANWNYEGVSVVALANIDEAGTLSPSYVEIPVGSLINGAATMFKHVVLGLSEASWATVTDDAVQLTVNAAEYVLQSGNFVKQWNFTRWSDETVNNLIADTALTSKKWYGYEFDTNGLLKRFKNYGATTSGPLTANGIEIMETLGILFPSGLTGGSGTPGAYDGKGDLSIRHNFGDDGIQLGSSNKTVTIQDLKQGQFVTIMLKSGNSTTARGISAVSNMTGAVGDATYMTGEQGDNVYNFEVVANGNATFTYNGGVIIRNIIVNQSPGVIEIIADPVVGIERDANTGVKTVTITCETEGVDIYYTTDGSATPDETSTLYTAPFTMEGTVFTVKVRAIKGNSKSQIVTTTWNDPFTFNPDAEYYVYSFGTNEGRNADNPKYLYAASAENLRWVEVAEGEDLPGKLGETSVTAAIWKLSAVDGNMVVFQNKSTGTSIIKYSFNYNLSAETPSTIAGANLGETGDAFYVAYRTEDKEKKVYSIQVSETDSKCMEVNDTRSETDLELANTVQFNNTYADRARFRWVIEDVNSTGFHPVDSGKVILSVEYIDLLGKRVAETTEGILIKKIRYTDGTSENKKVFLIK